MIHSLRSHARESLRSAVLSVGGSVQSRLAHPPTSGVYFVYGHRLLDEGGTRFDKHLSELAETFRFVTYSEAVSELHHGSTAERPAVCFSFDDGYESCRNIARVLERHQARGMFFLCPNVVGQKDVSKVAQFFRAPESTIEAMLSWDEIVEMRNAGHEFGSHTMNHVNLGQVSREQFDHEVGESREQISSRLDKCDHFAWPFGTQDAFPTWGPQAAREAGYRSCGSAERGHHHAMPDDLVLLREQVEPDWPLSHLQWFIARSQAADVA